MTIAEHLSEEDKKKVADIVMQDIREGMGNIFEFEDIRIWPGEDIDGEPYHHIVVVYSGDSELLDPAWLNGFKRRNRERLEELGIHLMTESYVNPKEDAEWERRTSHSL